ncbi:MAG: DUF1295 domain-containing protein [Clostridia bacterium]|nr:DUF1295 domain-containing protein [Clostridia bacterium]
MDYIYTLMPIFIYYVLLFIIGQIKKDNSIVDMVWGIGFLIPAWITFFLGHQAFKSFLVTLLVSIWALRLSIHIISRNLGKGEDFRYVNMRKKWGSHFVYLKAFIQVYMLQMLMLVLISASFVHTNLYGTGSLALLDILGLSIWLFGFFFETTADYQLAKFKKDPNNKGKILTTGLHQYTRHPNYFGEATMWWGIYVIGLSVSKGYLMIISPLVITILVRFVSGVPLLEKHYENRAEYQDYAKHTPIFLPKFIGGKK